MSLLHALRAASVLALLALVPPVSGGWSTDPAQNTVVVQADGFQSEVHAVADGVGGALLAWRDARAATPGLYAQHLDATGTRLWVESGALVAPVDSAVVQEFTVRAGPGGGLDVAWVAPGAGGLELRVQRLDAGGGRAWGAGGQVVTSAPSQRGTLSLIDDGAGGTIVVWADSRNNLEDSDVYAQRYSAAGVAQWTADGALVSAPPAAGGYQGSPRAREDGAGGAFVVWAQRDLAPQGLVAQHIDASGARLWGDGRGICCPSPQAGQTVAMAPDGAQTGLVFSVQQGGVFHLWAQRVDAEAAPQWGAAGVPVFDTPESFATAAFADGSGGILVLASRIASGAAVRVQRLQGDGSRVWGVDGVVVATAAGSFPRTSAAPDGSGGLIVVWPAAGPGDVDLRAQRVSATGTVLWAAGGVPLATATGNQSQSAAVATPAGRVIVAWSDRRPLTDDDVYAARLELDGTLPVRLESLRIE